MLEVHAAKLLQCSSQFAFPDYTEALNSCLACLDREYGVRTVPLVLVLSNFVHEHMNVTGEKYHACELEIFLWTYM